MEQFKYIISRLLDIEYHTVENLELENQQGGLFNQIYKITINNKTYYIKKYVDKNVSTVFSPPQIPKEIRAQLAFDVQDLCYQVNKDSGTIPSVYLDKEESILIVEGVPNPIVLIDCIEKGNINLDIGNKIAQTMGRFHNQFISTSYVTNEQFMNTKFRDFKLHLQYTELSNLFEDHIKNSIKELVEKYKQQLITILHGDLNSRNIAVDRYSNGLGIFDFEQSHIGNPIYDLAYFLSEIYISYKYHFKEKELENFVHSFLQIHMKAIPNFNLREYKEDLKQHIGIQILYRFLRPSKNS